MSPDAMEIYELLYHMSRKLDTIVELMEEGLKKPATVVKRYYEDEGVVTILSNGTRTWQCIKSYKF